MQVSKIIDCFLSHIEAKNYICAQAYIPLNFNPSDYLIKVLAIKCGREEKCRTQKTNAKIINDRMSQNEILEAVFTIIT
ncbi:hypothetical protein MXB_4394 [Myxobolus squamalis]|nr:hypothetical protein MXB_4394 [Myxobolus squamalis]